MLQTTLSRLVRGALLGAASLMIVAGGGLATPRAQAAGAWISWIQPLEWQGPVPGVRAAAILACSQELASESAQWRRALAAQVGVAESSVQVNGECQYRGPSISIGPVGLGLTQYRVVLNITCPCDRPRTIYGGPGSDNLSPAERRRIMMK